MPDAARHEEMPRDLVEGPKDLRLDDAVGAQRLDEAPARAAQLAA
jgi:hypothetical protein